MFFSHRMLRQCALLTPMLALGLAASPVHSAPSDILSDPSTMPSRTARADTNATFDVTINGVRHVTDVAGAVALLGWQPGEPNVHYFVGTNAGGPDTTSMSFELSFMDTSKPIVDGIYFFDMHKKDMVLDYGERDGFGGWVMYSPTGGYLDLKFSADRTWVEGKFAFNASRSDGAKDIAVEGTFSMSNRDLGL